MINDIIKFLAACLSLVVFSVPVIAAESTHAELFTTINQRLGLMQAVALYKAQNQIAVVDIAREQIVIADAKLSAAKLGLDPDSIEDFFAAQIAVAKAIQYRYRPDWLATAPVDEAVNLESEIRPALTHLGGKIITLLAATIRSQGNFSERQREHFYAAISQGHVSVQDRQLLFDALLNVRAD